MSRAIPSRWGLKHGELVPLMRGIAVGETRRLPWSSWVHSVALQFGIKVKTKREGAEVIVTRLI